MQGWVKLHRSIMLSSTFRRLNATQQLITIYIILNANHEDGVWYDKYKDIEVQIKRGQLVTSRNTIVNKWFENEKDITESKVRTTLNRLEKYGFLTRETTNGYTLITICNYSVYQGNGKESDQANGQALTKQSPSDDQAIATNKNVKNVKNDKNSEKTLSRKPKTIYDNSHYQLAELFYKEILKNNPNQKKPNLDNWANDIRLMAERDDRTLEQIEYLIKWVQQDSFEMANVMSTNKLRQRFDNLAMKVKTEHEGKKATTTGRQRLTQDDWASM